MEDNTIETSENNVEVAEQHEVLEDTNTTSEQTEETVENTADNAENTTDEVEVEETDTKPKQSEADNKAARLARLQAEKEAESKIEKVRKEAYEQGLRQGKVNGYIGKQNPYTGKTIQDEVDYQEYQDMYELDLAGKDPLGDYRELQKSRAREEAKKQIELDNELKQKKWYEDDAREFVDKYGEEKLQEILKDKDFDIFANGKIGSQHLAKIYEDFNALTQKYQKASVETAKKIVANNNATPGAIDEGEPQEINWDKMSSKQFAEYVQKAKDGELR